MKHVAIFIEPYLTKILQGIKTIESRFSKNKIAPFNQIKEGDTIIIKKSSGPVVGSFTAGKVRFFDLNPLIIETIKDDYGEELCLREEFWEHKKDAKYATLIDVKDPIKFKKPSITNMIPKNNRKSWIVIR